MDTVTRLPDVYFPNLGIRFYNLPRFLIGDDPDFSLIYISGWPFNIYLYAVMIAIGLTLAALVGFWYVHVSKQKFDDYFSLLIIGFFFAIIGLRFYFVIFNWEMYADRGLLAAMFDIRDGGLAIFGGIIGAAIAALVVSKQKKIPFRVMADTGAPSMLVGQSIGRWGNFFNREAFGGFSDGLFAMRIRVDQAMYTTDELLQTAVVYYGDVRYFQVHPTFLYESVLTCLFFVFLYLYRPHKKFDGEILLLYFFGYGLIRFIVERLRTDQMMLFGSNIPLNMVTSALFMLVSAALIIKGHQLARKKLNVNPVTKPTSTKTRRKNGH